MNYCYLSGEIKKLSRVENMKNYHSYTKTLRFHSSASDGGLLYTCKNMATFRELKLYRAAV